MRIFEPTFYYLCFIFCICSVTADVDLAMLLYGLVIKKIIIHDKESEYRTGGSFIPTPQIAIKKY